jgi:2-polyprenyl-3-methyl-5-hydroxy-6-metoxy-1,4-benzoquinol methylase
MNTVVCPICECGDCHDVAFGYRFEGMWLQAMVCPRCGIIFLHPPLSPEEIRTLYSKEYFEHDFRCGYAQSCFDSSHHDRLIDHALLKYLSTEKPQGRMLEIGCAGGAFLNAAKTYGFEVEGVELSRDAAEFARKNFALQVFNGTVIEADFNKDTFDVVVMGDVLEHLPNPMETLKEVWRIVRHGGLLVIISPTQTNSIFSRIGLALYKLLGKKVAIDLPPYHVFEYRPASLRNLLNRTGFAVVRESVGALHPRDLMLRGSILQRIGKKLFQYPNYMLTKLFDVFGDRITVYATKTTHKRETTGQ